MSAKAQYPRLSIHLAVASTEPVYRHLEYTHLASARLLTSVVSQGRGYAVRPSSRVYHPLAYG